MIDADRVSVVQRIRSHGKVISVSGQPSVNRRSATIQLLEQLVNRVLPLGKNFWFPTGDDQPLPAEIERPLNDYLTISTTRSLVVVPIAESEPVATDRVEAEPVSQKWLGGLVIEQFDARWTADEMSHVIDQVARHAGSALRNAVDHRSLLFYPVWHTLGKSKLVVAARNVRRTALIAAAAILIALVLIVVHVPFQVSCNGVLVPKNRRNVFAPVDGIVAETRVDHGSQVTQGQLVVRMDDNNLLLEQQRKLGEIAKLEQQLRSMDVSALTTDGRSPETDRNGTSDHDQMYRNSIKGQIDSLNEQLKTIDSELAKLKVYSPMDGAVLTWDVKEKLLDRPVHRGDPLLEVADVDGPWELELQLPDRRIGHVKRAQQKFGQELAVTFLLAAGPSQRWQGHITSVARATDVDQQNGQTVRILVDFDHNQLDIRQARSGVMAKIDCGRRSLGYVWLHDIYEFLQSKVLFHLW